MLRKRILYNEQFLGNLGIEYVKSGNDAPVAGVRAVPSTIFPAYAYRRGIAPARWPRLGTQIEAEIAELPLPMRFRPPSQQVPSPIRFRPPRQHLLPRRPCEMTAPSRRTGASQGALASPFSALRRGEECAQHSSARRSADVVAAESASSRAAD